MANVMDSEAVQVVESSFVVSSEPTPSEGLWLSPLDLILANRGHTPTVYLYSSSSNAVAAADGFFDVARLKEAMAKTLVAFYPLAGRLGVNNDDGRAEITCTGEGALFVVAHADLTVGDIEDDFRSSPELRRLFVPRIEPASIILAIQHMHALVCRVCLMQWSSRARSPPTVHPDALSRFYPRLTFSDPSGPLAFQVFVIFKDQVTSLKRLCGGTSTFCAIGALVWPCTLVARRLPPDSEARLTFSANVQRRVRPPLPSPEPLLRQCIGQAGRHRCSSRCCFGGSGVRGRPHQRRRRSGGRRVDDELV
ncbi:Spermidine hydroxycinnamoyl transferase [Zea mays]|uniref:Spermidine hydroxycinnamoyl transferase n=1 Tax=Zea mays TaxID=4577 RepID=A0A1D6MLX2_MAIZE|nr:Spermidine hydroxycinnamoyl transferase [Zea mays]